MTKETIKKLNEETIKVSLNLQELCLLKSALYCYKDKLENDVEEVREYLKSFPESKVYSETKYHICMIKYFDCLELKRILFSHSQDIGTDEEQKEYIEEIDGNYYLEYSGYKASYLDKIKEVKKVS